MCNDNNENKNFWYLNLKSDSSYMLSVQCTSMYSTVKYTVFMRGTEKSMINISYCF